MHRVCLTVLMALMSAVAQQPRYKETVDVSRILIDARVVNRVGGPLVGLDAADFGVRIDGKPARVESVQYLGGAEPYKDLPSAEFRGTVARSPRGRLIVFLVQKNLERSRIIGLMRLLTEVPTFLNAFSPDDRLAVLSFDSHLKVWVDFTNDLAAVRRVLQRGILLEQPDALHEAASPSLVARLERSRARRTHSIEDALAVVAEALAPLPGSKTVILAGHGFGRLTGSPGGFSSVVMENRYDDARRALQNARVSVFCLDITDNADYHSLEAGLQAVANDTGGFFERTHIFTRRALDRLAGALAGHYVLFVEKPEIRPGAHRIDVKLVRREGSVFAKSGYVD